MAQRKGSNATIAALLAVIVALAALLAFVTWSTPSTTRTVIQTLIQNRTIIQTATQKQTVVRVTNQTVVQVMSQTVTVTPSTSTMTVLQGEPCFGQEVWNVNSTGVPVLLMRPNSTAYLCVTFSTSWEGNASLYSGVPYGGEFPFNPSALSIARWNSTGPTYYSGTFPGCSRGECYQSFITSASPQSIPVNSATQYIDVLYTITALSNSTGFYDESAPYGYCGTMLLAVGYTASQVNASDFHFSRYGSCLFEYQFFLPVEVTAIGLNSTTIRR